MSRGGDIKAIWACWKKGGLESEDLYFIIKERYGKERMTFMTDGEVANLRRFVTGNSQRVAAKMRVDENNLRMTVKQWWKLSRQISDLGWCEERLRSFIKKKNFAPYCGGNFELIYVEDARKIITALEKIRAGEELKRLRGGSGLS